MRRIEQIGETVLAFLKSRLQKPIQSEAPQTSFLEGYTYTQIAEICDDAFATWRIFHFRGKNQVADRLYDELLSKRSVIGREVVPIAYTTAILIGLAKVGNLDQQDVVTLRGINYILPVIDQQYRPFCDAIARSIPPTEVVARVSRLAYASIDQLTKVTALGYDALVELQRRPGRFVPYTTKKGQTISSRKKFIAAFRGSDSKAGASVRFAVDLGVLSTQPGRLSSEEEEWCSKYNHYVRGNNDPRLNSILENFKGTFSTVIPN